jgi:sigma-B regulation protein RsbU (phosphoserine phosphatase)
VNAGAHDQLKESHHALQCMEIWGGSSAAERSVSTPGLDLWVWSRPYQQAAGGGDVHYVSLCGGGLITRLILADVSGHGASVAELASSLRDLMRRNINRKSQSRLVRDLNRQFTELAKMSCFATSVLATYLANRDQLTICNAGHPRPLWFRATARRWSFVDADQTDEQGGLTNLPLGVEDSTYYPQVTLNLDLGDIVLIYTDALTEASGMGGAMLGEQGLLELVRTIDASNLNAMSDALVNRLDQYRGGRPADDDTTFLLLHHNAGNPRRLSVRQKLDVYAKVFHIKDV